MQEFIRHTRKSIGGVSTTFGHLEYRENIALSLMDFREHELHEPVQGNNQYVPQCLL